MDGWKLSVSPSPTISSENKNNIPVHMIKTVEFGMLQRTSYIEMDEWKLSESPSPTISSKKKKTYRLHV
jgi:hypothetical protein